MEPSPMPRLERLEPRAELVGRRPRREREQPCAHRARLRPALRRHALHDLQPRVHGVNTMLDASGSIFARDE